ncbi:S-layer protein [Bacillus sp. NTK034]|uniref:S-layer protein n=1 Tax=Bacillus sp. NTK034 TaxID=2802176 RepID=UPI001A8E2CC6|nr:S-layer protein [Bacillus sp. NTK034]MBN8201832.1 S-layer protein [Bacillus sp. NTK034]
MAKKKAIKLAAASAVAASAFVAAAPAQTDAASNVAVEVSKAVTQMKKAYHTYSDVTQNGEFAPIADVYKEYNAAKAAYKNAKALATKAGGEHKEAYLAQLDATYNEYIAKRVVTYIDAFNYATALEDKKEALEAALEGKEWDKAEELYHEISYELKTRTVILHRVYGQTARELLVEAFKLEAQDTRDSITNEVSVKMYYDNAEKLVAEDKLVEAKAAMDHVADFVAKLDKDTDFGAALLTKVSNVKAAYEAKLAPVVESVSSVSATQVEVKFNVPVDKASVLDANGAIKSSATFTLSALDGQGPVSVTGAKLSADGKVLTLTTSAAVSKRYDVVVNGLKAANGKDVAKFQKVVAFDADTTAPAILSTTKNSASSFTVKFSEPLNSLGTVSYKLANGATVAAGSNGVTNNFQSGAQEVTFTIGSDVAAGKEVLATFVGTQDKAGNLLTPNPATVSFVKGSADGVAPTVSAISQTGAKTFTVKFSEELISVPTVTVSGTSVTNVEKDANDPTLYKVTTAGALNGAQTVAVSAFADLSGEAGTATSKVVTFVKDTAAPKVASSAVVADATTNKEYLEVTFDKDVVLNANPTVNGTGSYVKDYVTTNVSAVQTPVSLKANTKNVVRVELDAFLGTSTDVEGAVYNLTLSFANVDSAAGVAADTAKVSFTRGKDGVPANTAVVGVTGVAQSLTDNNKVEVTFDKAVDGASATNVANYRIDGAVVSSVTLKPAVTANGVTTQVAVLNLQAGSNNFTGVRNINISGVKALGSSKVMDPYFTNQVSLKENIAPTVTSAKLTAVDTITLTFSEVVTSGIADDFEILIGGKSQATPDTANVVINNGVATMTISSIDATELAAGISLKTVSALDITDAAGNKLSVPANVTVSQ